MIWAAIISSVSLVLVAVIGVLGNHKLNNVQHVQDRIEINTNHRMDEFLKEIKKLRKERDIRTASDLKKARKKND